MRIFLLLEPPFSTISLELEDAALTRKYYYFSLSDVFISETAGGSATAKRLKESIENGEEMQPLLSYRIILEKYLQKPPRNFPNGIILDPDCFGTAEELQVLLEVIEKYGNKIEGVIDIQTDAEECADYIEDFGVDEADGLLEISDYFENLYPEAKKIFKKKDIEIIATFSPDEDPRKMLKQFTDML